jgi:hypothetical protein
MTIRKLVFTAAILFNSCILNADEGSRVYLEPDRIVLNNNEMFIELADGWVEAIALHCDGQGLYVLRSDLKEGGSRVTEWPKHYKCPYCHRPTLVGEQCLREDCPRILGKKDKKPNS